MQVVLGAMLTDAAHAALEDRIEALNRVRVDFHPLTSGVEFGATVFLDGMLDAALRGELGADLFVELSLIGHQRRFLGDVGADDRHDLSDRRALDMERAGLAAALDHGQHGILERLSAAALALRQALQMADERLIDFNELAPAAHGREIVGTHGLTDTMGQEPSRLVGALQRPMELVSADALL